MTNEHLDATATRMYLNELKSQFDDAMRHGEVFENLKKMYMQIKEMECRLKVMEWEADKARSTGKYNRMKYPLL